MKPQIHLAPMAGMTDRAMREISADFFSGSLTTEMVSIAGLFYKDKKTPQLMEGVADVLQVFGKNPEYIEVIAPILNAHDSKIIELNLGCPAPKITANGEGSAMMKDLGLASDMIGELVRCCGKPISIKFRSGWDDSNINYLKLADLAEGLGVRRLVLHPRTRKQMYQGHSEWGYIRNLKQQSDLEIVGSGDIKSPEDALRMLDRTGCDGLMIGRAAMGNPWLLGHCEAAVRTGALVPTKETSLQQIVDVALRHLDLLVKYKGERTGTEQMRKHASHYIKGRGSAARLRGDINSSKTHAEMRAAISRLILDC